MAKVNNKEILQSYILTAAKYDFSVYEKRVLYNLVELAQKEVEGLDFRNGKDCRKIDHDLFNYREIELACSAVLKDENDKNHDKVKKAILSLAKKVIEYEDDKTWIGLNIVAFPRIKKRANTFSFTIHPMIWDCILDFTKGFRPIELKVIKDLVSEYSMRFYELMSRQQGFIDFNLDTLKSMFKLENKYRSTNMFIKKVIDTAQNELNEKSPYSFTYKKKTKGKKIVGFRFYPVKIAKNIDEDIRLNRVVKELSIQDVIPEEVEEYMMKNFGITTKEMKQHYKLLKEAYKKLDLLGLLAEKKRYIADAEKPMGYIVAILRERINVDEEEEPIEVPEEGTYREPTEEERREAAAAIAELNKRIEDFESNRRPK